MTKRYMFEKRVFDLFFAFLTISVLVWWLLPLLAMIVLLQTRKNPFQIETLTGRRGKRFSCITLRTNRFNSWGVLEQSSWGNFMQRTGLFALPLFFHVISGRMSLTGPKAFHVREDEQYAQVLKGYYARYAFKPGMTGLSAIKKNRQPRSESEIAFNRHQWDCFYLRNANIQLDFRIISKSLANCFKAFFKPAVNKTVPIPTKMGQVLRATQRLGALNN